MTDQPMTTDNESPSRTAAAEISLNMSLLSSPPPGVLVGPSSTQNQQHTKAKEQAVEVAAHHNETAKDKNDSVQQQQSSVRTAGTMILPPFGATREHEEALILETCSKWKQELESLRNDLYMMSVKNAILLDDLAMANCEAMDMARLLESTT